ncbi:MAG: DUF4337 domain-containing protein, partial [Stellaceae bacterium]
EVSEMPKEHLQHHSHEGGLVKWIAIFTAVISTIGAIIGHEAEEIANKAILLKNESVLIKTDAADKWNYYQAVSTKGHVMELGMDLVPLDRRPPYAAKIKKYDAQKREIKIVADKLDAASAKANKESAALAGPRGNYMYALALLQVAISVVSVSLLSRQRWLFAMAILLSLVGLGTAGYAFMLTP